MYERLKVWAKRLKSELVVLAAAANDPRTPWYAKAIGVFVIAYALSPLDLIPDFIPVIGYLDDLLLVPAGIWLVRRLIPKEVLAEYQASVDAGIHLPPNRRAAVIIVLLWIAAITVLGRWLWEWLGRPWIS